MISPIQLEEAYKEFSQNCRKWAPDGIIEVNLSLLQDLGLLHHAALNDPTTDEISHLFNVVETDEKVTLFNEQFAIWIVPKIVDEIPATLTYIALLSGKKPHLEIVFSTSGIYNTPRYIIKVLEHFLMEVTETEATISAMDKKASS